jgi:hypothetical protein
VFKAETERQNNYLTENSKLYYAHIIYFCTLFLDAWSSVSEVGGDGGRGKGIKDPLFNARAEVCTQRKNNLIKAINEWGM